MHLPVDAAYRGSEVDLVSVQSLARTNQDLWALAQDVHNLIRTDEHVKERASLGQPPEKVWEALYDPNSNTGRLRTMQYLVESLKRPNYIHEVYAVLYQSELIGVGERRPSEIVTIELQESGRHVALRGLHQALINRPAGTAELHIAALVDTVDGLTTLTDAQTQDPVPGVVDVPFAVDRLPSTDNRLVVAYGQARYSRVAANVLLGSGVVMEDQYIYTARPLSE